MKKMIITEEEKKEILKLYEQSFFSKVWNKGKDFFDDTPCSTDYTDDAKDWKDLYRILINKKKITKGTPILIVWGPTQTMYFTKDGRSLIKEIKVSTGAWGFGNTGSNPSTNTGLMKITNKRKAPKKYQVFVSKSPINLVLGPNVDSKRKDRSGQVHEAEVITGLLELGGLEQCNKNVAARGVYIHGTNKENNLGNKASNGCIRVSSDDVLFLINNIPDNCKVYVKP